MGCYLTRGDTQQSFTRRYSAPRSNPWPLNIWLKSYPFRITFIYKKYYRVNCSKCTDFKIWINHKTRTFSRLSIFTGRQCTCQHLWDFLQTEMTDSLPFHKLCLVKSLPFHKPEVLQKVPLPCELPFRTGHYRNRRHVCSVCYVTVLLNPSFFVKILLWYITFSAAFPWTS